MTAGVVDLHLDYNVFLPSRHGNFLRSQISSVPSLLSPQPPSPTSPAFAHVTSSINAHSRVQSKQHFASPPGSNCNEIAKHHASALDGNLPCICQHWQAKVKCISADKPQRFTYPQQPSCSIVTYHGCMFVAYREILRRLKLGFRLLSSLRQSEVTLRQNMQQNFVCLCSAKVAYFAYREVWRG